MERLTTSICENDGHNLYPVICGEDYKNLGNCSLNECIDKLGKHEDVEEWFSKKKFYGKALNEPNKILELEFERIEFRPKEDLLLIHFKVLNDWATNIFYNIFSYGTGWALTRKELEK